ncbi:anaerobic sulfatase maturase [Clostridium tertium]|jgi:uncharacterized protein|uniref:anaerobic sulfatase maturase n=3 Tax=Clostridiaceae TaxID=31979 RepID=UPI0018AB2C1D|nr:MULTISPECIES: anaerobic sulfatase maturase [Clostridium]MBS5307113.1 anaerobic sulfatase maturase [Clostridium sp.]MDB1924416.1 anaerobic sulfatase maturase [Clostridium tertium]MDB1927842.1 anaerobic sulfatase maturase [Clostridium tertium]MDB1931466.1 anaerobic sulfatase maturase [Clostridium tertium]MDB1934262.1 anaerobic sulfatase maturase [Clostridium tertium]
MRKNLSLMIKPSSSKCNLKCKYCFYNSISDSREIKDYGLMKEDTIKKVLDRVFEYCNGGNCSIAFQGGEPLLIGIGFYKQLIDYIRINNFNSTTFSFALQTNGTLINNEWANFFSENNFLIGISLDGNKDLHNLNRVDHLNNDSFNRVMNGIHILENYNVDYNILTVITSALCKKIDSTYNFYKKKNFNYLQFIPCLEPLENSQMDLSSFSITPSQYGDFLIKLFDLWYKDALSDKYVSIRFFDNILGLFLNKDYEACEMKGICSCQHIIESNAEVYPCDFYTYESYSIGNILENSFEDIHKNSRTLSFINSSKDINDKCKNCAYLNFCRGGCRRHRENQKGNLNYFCESYYKFYSHSLEKFETVALKIQRDNFRR